MTLTSAAGLGLPAPALLVRGAPDPPVPGESLHRARPRRGCFKSHSDATLYILHRGSLMKHTGTCYNDFNVQG
jgi:hypothetical protein